MKLVKPDLKNSFEELLCSAQLIALSLVIILSGTTPRSVITEYPAANVTIFVDFRSVMIFPFDYPLIVFIVLGLIRTVMSKPWRATLRRMFDRHNQMLIYWIPFVGFTLMSVLWATYPLLAAVAAVRLLLYGSAAVIVAGLFLGESGNYAAIWTFRTVALIGVVQSVIGLAQVSILRPLGWFNLGEMNVDIMDRAFGLTVNPNNLAGYLLFAGVSVAVLMARDDRDDRDFPGRIGKSVEIGLALLLLAGMLATGSRTMLFSGALAFILLRGLTQVRSRGINLFWLLRLAPAILAIGAVVLIISQNANRMPILERLGFGATEAFRLIQQVPLQGDGAWNTQLRAMAVSDAPASFTLLPVHNIYILLVAELGLFGLLLFGVGWWATIRNLISHVFPMSHAEQQRIPLLWGALTLVFSLFGDYYFWLDQRS